MEDGEEDRGVFGDLPFLADLFGVDAGAGVFGEGGEGVVSLIGQAVAVSQEEDARATGGLAGEVPAGLEELPGNLEGDKGFAGACGEGQENAFAAAGDRIEDALDGNVLVIAGSVGAAFVFVGDIGEAIPPVVGLGVGEVPEFLGRRPGVGFAFLGGFAVDGVDALAVARVGEADIELFGVVFGLSQTGGQRRRIGFGFDNGQLGVAIDEDLVGNQRLGATSFAFDAAEGDLVFAKHPRAVDGAPASGGEGRVDQFRACFGFVHGSEDFDTEGTESTEGRR